jgi:hypothetical protein
MEYEQVLKQAELDWVREEKEGNWNRWENDAVGPASSGTLRIGLVSRSTVANSCSLYRYPSSTREFVQNPSPSGPR